MHLLGLVWGASTRTSQRLLVLKGEPKTWVWRAGRKVWIERASSNTVQMRVCHLTDAMLTYTLDRMREACNICRVTVNSSGGFHSITIMTGSVFETKSTYINIFKRNRKVRWLGVALIIALFNMPTVSKDNYVLNERTKLKRCTLKSTDQFQRNSGSRRTMWSVRTATYFNVWQPVMFLFDAVRFSRRQNQSRL